ncbi:MAG: class I SAM-dependent methyltransferase [Balneolales bacterium]
MAIMDSRIDHYAYCHTKPEDQLLTELISKTERELEFSQMLSGRVEGKLVSMLIKLAGARIVLEIGMFTGFSALIMAEALPEQGKIITCDVNEKYATIARHFFDRSPHGYKIDVRIGKAIHTIESIHEPIDMVFMDADKDNYPNYYELVIPKLRAGGIIVVDNALWNGAVLDPKEPQEKAIDRLNKIILKDDRVENVLLTVRDGINLVRKI